MKCDECKDQVFELIEREAVDPDGVREILARCPDCRAAFDEMKAALAVAEQLPIAEPPAAVDAAILRAAGERAPRVVRLKRRRLQPAPWAMAAIAMLAVGVGVWTIPREVQLEGDAAPADMKYAEETVIAEQVFEDEEEAYEGRLAQAEIASNDTAQLRTVERTEAKLKKGSPEPARAKRRSGSSGNEPRASRDVRAPASVSTDDMAVAGMEELGKSRPSAVAAEAPAPRKQEQDDDDVTATCHRKVDEIERRAGADKDHAPTPEEELAIGKCYQTLNKVAEARKWLQRAAEHRETKARANKALRQLAPE
ncbi:MAG: hypothetical protein JRJ80_10700 [Deltaproteobacteria bacterium]|nr:hypothetical protein [Deltaproteobacteria bacterium]